MLFRSNYAPKLEYTDILTRDDAVLPTVDLYMAGFPCQPFSEAGGRLGMADPRAAPFLKITPYIRTTTPNIFPLENVPGLASIAGGSALRKLLSDVSCPGQYAVKHAVLDASKFGSHQHRPRI